MVTKNVILGQAQDTGTKPRPRGRLRDAMPETAAFLDALREAFGAPGIDAAIAAGMRGEPGFYAREAGYEVGTADTAGESFEVVAADRWQRTAH